ncbi:MAG: hypothetical protein C4539_11560 [Ignavibacteriales bacterium]|nr:MAG: hypothetical protein C4539_11560 [Ignavibacteriales bacterium]
MDYAINLMKSKTNIKSVITDLLGLAFIYFTPAISHLFSFPVYYLEPMRIMTIIAIAHTSRKNAYLLAVTLPLFSFLISSHPSLVKTGLITGELLLNVWLFIFLTRITGNNFLAMISSIVTAKIAYYVLKFLLIQAALINGELMATPLLIQVITTIAFSTYIYLWLKRKEQ